MSDTQPDWQIKLEAANAVNRTPPDKNGMWRWKCENCGLEWQEKAPTDYKFYDRQIEHTKNHIICNDCYKH